MLTPNGFSAPFAIRTLVLAVCLTASAGAALAQTRQAAASRGSEAAVQALSLQQTIERVRTENRAILSKKKEAEIVATGITRAEAAFQPQLNLGAVRGSSRMRNTFEEDLIRRQLGVYERDGTDFTAGISTVVPATGAKLEVKSMLSRFITNNNLQQPNRPPGAYDNRTTTGFSLTQPLARDAGPEVTRARLDMARLDTEAAEFASRDTEVSVVGEAMLAYYELVLAQKRVEAAREKIRTSTALLAEARALRRNGRLSQSDVWEVQNALARYQSAHSEAVQGHRERSNRLRALLMLEASDVLLSATDELPAVLAPADRESAQLLVQALERRDDYRMRKLQAEREGVQIAYARNQQLPRIDLVASYGLNGLEYSARSALDLERARAFPSWTLGLQVNVPLGANLQAQADMRSALLRREDALLALKAIEVQIANDIDTSLALVSSTIERWSLWQEVAERESEQLAAERAKFNAGRSDTRELLLRQERLINARLSVIEQQVAFARAQALLQAAQGSLMERWR